MRDQRGLVVTMPALGRNRHSQFIATSPRESGCRCAREGCARGAGPGGNQVMTTYSETVRSFQVACLCASRLRKGGRACESTGSCRIDGCIANGWEVAELARRPTSSRGTRRPGVAAFAVAQTAQRKSISLRMTKSANAARECHDWSNALPTWTSTACTAPPELTLSRHGGSPGVASAWSCRASTWPSCDHLCCQKTRASWVPPARKFVLMCPASRTG